MHTRNLELSDYVTDVTGNPSGHMTQMPISRSLEALKGQEAVSAKGLTASIFVPRDPKNESKKHTLGAFLVRFPLTYPEGASLV